MIFGMRLCKDYGDPKKIKNLWIAEILTKYVSLENYLEIVVIITTIY